jgi:hypothetical protein
MLCVIGVSDCTNIAAYLAKYNIKDYAQFFGIVDEEGLKSYVHLETQKRLNGNAATNK